MSVQPHRKVLCCHPVRAVRDGRVGKSPLRAFTLIEVLVAAAVLGLLLVLVFQLTSSASHVTGQAQQRLSADADARQLLDRMGADFQRMVLRPGVPARFEKRVGNDRMVFLAARDGYDGDRGVSVVSYGDVDGADQLQRGASGRYWSNASPLLEVVFTNSPPTVPPIGSASESATAQIFRIETAFLLSDGSLVADPPTQSLLPSGGNRTVQAVVVGIAAVDPLLIERAQTTPSDLAAKFDEAENGKDILTVWQAVLDGNSLPPPVKAGTRIYQRFFPLPPQLAFSN